MKLEKTWEVVRKLLTGRVDASELEISFEMRLSDKQFFWVLKTYRRECPFSLVRNPNGDEFFTGKNQTPEFEEVFCAIALRKGGYKLSYFKTATAQAEDQANVAYLGDFNGRQL